MHGPCCTLCCAVVHTAIFTPSEQRPTHTPKSVKKAKNAKRRYDLLHLSLVVLSSRGWVSTIEHNGLASSQFLHLRSCNLVYAKFHNVRTRRQSFSVCQTMFPTFQANHLTNASPPPIKCFQPPFPQLGGVPSP